MKHHFKTLITNGSTAKMYEFDFDGNTSIKNLDAYLDEIDCAICKDTRIVAFVYFRGLDTVCTLHIMVTPPIVEWYTVNPMVEKVARDLFLSI